MSHASAGAIRQAIVNNILNQVTSLDNAYPYLISNATPPCALVMRGQVTYDQSMGSGVNVWEFVVRVFVANVTDVGAATKLDSYLDVNGSNSIKAAIESDRQLGGLVSDLHVTMADGEKEFVRDTGGPLLGSEWTVEVWL